MMKFVWDILLFLANPVFPLNTESMTNGQSNPILLLIANQLQSVQRLETKIEMLQNKSDEIQDQISLLKKDFERRQHMKDISLQQFTAMTKNISDLRIDIQNLKTTKSCGPDWMEHEHHCYYFGFTKTTWHNAKILCQRRGAFLVQIDSSTENSWLGSELTAYGNNQKSFWIGANDLSQEGTWRWVNDNSAVTYTNWFPGEPNDNNRAEDCGLLYNFEQYQWNDGVCLDREHGYICEQSKQ